MGIRVATLVDGSMGTALAHVVGCQPNRTARLWCPAEGDARAVNAEREHPRFFRGTRLSDGLHATADMAEAVDGADIVVVSAGSGSFVRVVDSLRDVLRGTPLVLTSTKGFEPTTEARLVDVLAERFPRERLGVIAGANITPDIMAGKLTALLVATPQEASIELARSAFTAPAVRVIGDTDLNSVELVSVLKNAAALTATIAQGAGLAINTVAYALTRAVAEVGAVVTALGGSTAPLLQVCGIGDLYLTCTHDGSLNRRVGRELGAGRPLAAILADLPEVPEGITSVRVACRVGREHGLRLPLLDGALDILEGRHPPARLLALLEAT